MDFVRDLSDEDSGTMKSVIDDDDDTDCQDGEEDHASSLLVKDGNKQYTVVSPKDRLLNKRRHTIIAAVVIVIIVSSICLVMGALIGYSALQTKSTQQSNQKESIWETVLLELSNNTWNSNPPVLLISLDGFRTEYLSRGVTPTILSLMNHGVYAEFMKPSFPSKTFPNHFTLVTGLYPEAHGIVGNYFYDRVFREIFAISSPVALDPKWWLGEPIWVTAHNAVLKTGVYFWPGSEVPIEGILPDYYFKYNKSTPFQDRINTVLGWFDLAPRVRPQFMASYFEEPDASGHEFGPDSDKINDALREVDGVIHSYIEGLKEREIFDCVNIVLVSDHGMTTTDRSMTVILFPDLLPEEYSEKLEHFSYGVFSMLYVNETELNEIQEIYNVLKQNIEATNSPVDVYLRDEAPPEYNIGKENTQRYGDIILVPRIGAYIKESATIPRSFQIGQHGYNNSETDMHTIFIGHGPSFKSGVKLDPFQNVEVYNVLCKLLDIAPSGNNGTVGLLSDAFVH